MNLRKKGSHRVSQIIRNEAGRKVNRSEEEIIEGQWSKDTFEVVGKKCFHQNCILL